MRTFRIHLIALAVLAAVPMTTLADRHEDGFVSIFDGKTLEGWDGNPEHWRIEDGAITGESSADDPLKNNVFVIWRQGELDDFELKCEYRITGGNSGIQYRSFEVPEAGKWVIGGYQADLEAGDKWSGTNYGERYRGILAERGQKTVIGADHKPKVVGATGDPNELGEHIKKNDWNTYHIIAKGYHFVQKINGVVMSECTDEDKEKRRRSGLLAFQLHAGPPMKVQFRNIQLKRLPMKDVKKVVLVAGKKSHGYGAHEHNAGCILLAKELNTYAGDRVHATVCRDGWPSDPTAFDNANGIVMYCDGGHGHMVVPHLKQVHKLAKKGVGIACIHYGVEVEKGEPGDAFLDWIGGYFEIHWSVNPHWTADFTKLPKHAITNGVEPFTLHDEWYYHMRFRENEEEVAPILTAIPPAETLSRPDGPHSGNPHVRAKAGQPQHVAWAYERPDGSRGFGTTGGHFHWNWGHNDFRRLVLNALVWIAGSDVPTAGVPTKSLTVEDLMANQDEPVPDNFKKEDIAKNLREWNENTADRQSSVPYTPGQKFLRTKLKDLQSFKSDAKFHEFGFGRGGPYFAWLESVEAQRDSDELSLRERVAVGDLATLGLEYIQTKGRENRSTRAIRSEINTVAVARSK